MNVIRKFECTESFDVDEVDAYGFSTGGYITIENGEVFELVDSDEFSVTLDNEEGKYLIISNNLFEECFEEV